MLLTEENVKAISNKVDDFVEKVKETGTNIDDEKVQLDILKKMLDSDFNLDKVNPEEINEYDESLEESAGGIGHSLHMAMDTIEGSEMVQQQIINRLGISSSKIKTAIKWIKKILMAVPNFIDKLFYKLARLLGLDIEGAKIAGKVGLGIFAIICLCVAIMSFPSVLAGFAGGFSILAIIKLFAALAKGASAIWNMWKKFKAIKKESADEVYFTTNDFLQKIEPTYMKAPSVKGEKIPDNWAYALEGWYKSRWSKEDGNNKKRKNVASKKMKQFVDGLKKGKFYESQLGELADIAKKTGNKEVEEIFNTLKLTLNSKHMSGGDNPNRWKKNSEIYTQKERNLMEIRQVVKEVVRESYNDDEKFTIYYDSENKKAIDSELVDRYRKFFDIFVKQYTKELQLSDKSWNIFLDSENLDSDDIFNEDGGDGDFLKFYAFNE
jgi:hypothetical protein